MTRKIFFFVWITIVVGCFCLQSALADDGREETVKVVAGLYYTVQKGDTLWDISERFYDSPWVWPDLWAKNPQILNPNWISPGEQIRLFSREHLETIVELGPQAPESDAQPRPEPPYYLYPTIDKVGFIREKAVTPSGTIFNAMGDKDLIVEGNLVYIRASGKAAFRAGDRYTVFRTLKPLKNQRTKKLIGIQHCIMGILEITDVQPEFSIGKIIDTFRVIDVNDLVMPYEPQSPKITLIKGKEGLKGKIIIAERNEGIFATQAVVFIDMGRKDGVKVGQSYSVYYQEEEYLDPKRKESILLPPVNFGEILILRTEESTATALVTMARKAIEPGAMIHGALGIDH